MKVSVLSSLTDGIQGRLRPVLLLFALLAGMLLPAAPAGAAGASADQPNFGPNVYIFDPSMSTSQIQATVDSIAQQQVDNEMGSQRYALLFKPGTYGTPSNPLTFQVGYYTEVAGLGVSPTEVTINGHVDVYNRCLSANNCLALVNFWRSLSNLTIHVMGLDGCRASGDFWAVSQAAPMRRVNITGGNLTLMDYCTAGPQYASGGYIADSQTGFIINGSQQQFLVRDSSISGWSNAVWNQVFSGVTGAPAQSFPTPPYTTLATSPVSAEKPYLFVDADGNYSVFVPAVRTNSSGTSWAAGPTAGTAIPLRQFYVAQPGDSAATINAALQRNLNLIFTPGVYHLNQTITVTHPHTVVYGLGLATLVPDNGVVAMQVADVDGVQISGLLFDAGPVNSPVLLQVGAGMPGPRQVPDPVVLHDLFFRIGGASAGKATTSLVVNTNGAILDDIWAWRADHGSGVGWTVNTAETGVVINGRAVTAYGLFVEHYQKNELIWNGDQGTAIFFQNEMPYDPPNQAAWMNGARNGYAAFKVGDAVTSFQGYGLGSYCYFNVNPSVNAYHAFEAPTAPGVQFHDLLTISLAAGTITHVINDTGATTPLNVVPVTILNYP
ncbi:MAG TPA: adenylyl cyclase [Chloroflexia bacterium]|nr:adenylyl cyclase [Chloroflexia bacterium]